VKGPKFGAFEYRYWSYRSTAVNEAERPSRWLDNDGGFGFTKTKHCAKLAVGRPTGYCGDGLLVMIGRILAALASSRENESSTSDYMYGGRY